MNLKKSIMLILTAALFFAGTCYSDDLSTTSYFPLHYGNQWNFQTIPAGLGLSMTWSISDTTTINGQHYYIFQDVPIRYDSSGAIWKYTNEKEILWFDFSMEEDSSYTFEEWELLYIVKVSRNIQIDTPFGKLDNCIRFAFNVPEAVDTDLFYTFAPDIGPVRFMNSINPYELFQATINGELITRVDSKNRQPDNFVLRQNYPNPFNALSKISFSMKSASNIKIEVYSSNGCKIETLLNKYMNNGDHVITWDASKYASGIYFVFLKTGKETGFIKCLLIK